MTVKAEAKKAVIFSLNYHLSIYRQKNPGPAADTGCRLLEIRQWADFRLTQCARYIADLLTEGKPVSAYLLEEYKYFKNVEARALVAFSLHVQNREALRV